MSRRTAKNDVLYLNIIAVLGILLILGAFFVSASLLTWSINDPSLSYASTGEINNIMGRAGAIVADALLQLFGLSVAFAVFPLFNWGWRMIFNAGVNRIHWRFMAWLASIMISCLTLSVFAIPPSWPLPGGLGGVSGDLLLKLIIDATGLADNSFVVILFAALCGITAAMLFCYALGVRLIGKSGKIKKSKRVKPANSANDEDKNSLFAVAIGGVLHVSYLLICWLKKLALSIYAMLKPERNKQRHQIARPNLGLDLPDTMIDYGEMDEHSDGSGETKKMRVVRRNQVGNFVLPSRNLLTNNKRQLVPEIDDTTLESNAKILEGVLDDFGVKGEVLRVCPGPLVTLYEFEPAPGIKSSRIIGLADDIARSMSALSARVSVVPGRNVIGIELPNEHRKTVYLREVFESRSFANVKQTLVLCLGLAIDGEPVVADLAGMPHLLIAGTTGSGKSVGINTMILSVLYRLSPDKCRLILIDPKMLELSVYDGIPHLLTPVVTDPKKAVVALKWAVKEMERRYRDMSRLGVRNIDGYNAKLKEIAQNGEDLSRTVQTGFDDETGEAVFETEQLDLEPIPYIVVVVDEMADLMMVAGKDIEAAIQRLAQMARAAGIHLIMATQRPSVDVITGTIKANFPTRISFQVTSKIDSRTILGEQGAEQLLGRGDMLYMQGGGRISRIHAPYVSDMEVEKVVNHLKKQGVPEYLDEVTQDDGGDGSDSFVTGGSGNDLYDQAVAIVLNDRKASTSYIQRRLSIGYNRAATLIEKMEQEGIISAANHVGRREILVQQNDAAHG